MRRVAIRRHILGKRPISVAIWFPDMACIRILRSGCFEGSIRDACRGVMIEKCRGFEKEKGLRGEGKTCLRRA